MANNILTSLLGEIYSAVDSVSRELQGFIPSVTRNSTGERAALNQTIRVPVSVGGTLEDVHTGMTVSEPQDQQISEVDIVVDKSKTYSFGLTGEEFKGLENGIGVNEYYKGQFEQAFRALTNAVETDIAVEAAKSASRYYGTAGTTPFASDLSDINNLKKILDDNGAPFGLRSFVMNTDSGVNMRNLTQLTNVNEAGTSMTLRQGTLGDLSGFMVKESAQIVNFVKGTAAGMVVDASAYAVEATELTLGAVTTPGTIKEGDIVVIAGDTNKYVVAKAVTTAGVGTVVEIHQPGLRVAIEAAATPTITILDSSARNVGFTADAIQLVTRPPALPGGVDSAADSYMVTDPYSGMTFEVRVYLGERKNAIKISLVWGVKAIKPAHIAGILG